MCPPGVVDSPNLVVANNVICLANKNDIESNLSKKDKQILASKIKILLTQVDSSLQETTQSSSISSQAAHHVWMQNTKVVDEEEIERKKKIGVDTK